MKEFKSAFRPSIMEYLEFRSAMGYSNEHEQQLQHFDRYCYEHCPEQTELTKEVVRGWFYDEIARGRSCLSSKATAIRLFAKYLGVSAYILPMSCVPKTPDYLPYILTDSELAALFHAADTMEYKNDPFFRETASVLLRLLYSCGLRPNEGRNIKLEHINFKTGELFITKTKRRKERIVVASDDMLLLLKKYRSQRAIFDKGNEYFLMLIDLTQHATRCSDSSGQAQEYLIARHAAVETETVLVQICLELGAPSVICSLKECFQITDCLVYPMQIICFVFLCVQFHTFQIQVAFVTVAFYLCFWHKILVDDFLQSLSLYVIYYLHPGKQWCTVCCFGYGHHNLGLIRTTTSFAVMGRSANIAVIQLYNAGKQVFFVSLTHSGTNSIQ